jgi:hypothetical protein
MERILMYVNPKCDHLTPGERNPSAQVLSCLFYPAISRQYRNLLDLSRHFNPYILIFLRQQAHPDA